VRKGGGGFDRRGGKGAQDGPTGRVVEVLERGHSRFAGTLTKDGREWLVVPDGRSLRDPVVVRDPGAKGAKQGDKVVFEIIRYPTELDFAEGVITEVLGEAGRPDVETRAVIDVYHLKTGFADESMDARRTAHGRTATTSRASSSSPSIRPMRVTSTTPSASATTPTAASGSSACTSPTSRTG
jgi:ribonuclease R